MSHVPSSFLRSRRLRGAACLSFLVATALVGCGDETPGTDIEVPAGGTNSGGTSSTAGTAGTGNRAGNTQSGSANEGGDAGNTSDGGEPGSSGSNDGGSGNAGGTGVGGTNGNGGGVGGGSTSGSGGGGAGGGGMGGGGAGGTGGGGTGGGGAGSGGSSGSAGSSSAVCGDGNVQGAEECDGGIEGTPYKGDRLCSIDCEEVSTQACVDCEQAGDCFASSDNCQGPAGAPFTAEEIRSCYDVQLCIQDSNCLDGTGSVGKCYCGTLSTAACGAAPFNLASAGAPNGPCAAIMQKGAPGVTTNSGILGGLTNKSRPFGAAGQRLNCQKFTECGEVCGISP